MLAVESAECSNISRFRLDKPDCTDWTRIAALPSWARPGPLLRPHFLRACKIPSIGARSRSEVSQNLPKKVERRNWDTLRNQISLAISEDKKHGAGLDKAAWLNHHVGAS